jgi:hypothetical protein
MERTQIVELIPYRGPKASTNMTADRSKISVNKAYSIKSTTITSTTLSIAAPRAAGTSAATS